jgi:hypothetical protein
VRGVKRINITSHLSDGANVLTGSCCLDNIPFDGMGNTLAPALMLSEVVQNGKKLTTFGSRWLWRCRREFKVSFKSGIPYTTFSTVSLQVDLTPPLERSHRASQFSCKARCLIPDGL